jgi:hypothetical protein
LDSDSVNALAHAVELDRRLLQEHSVCSACEKRWKNLDRRQKARHAARAIDCGQTCRTHEGSDRAADQEAYDFAEKSTSISTNISFNLH